MRNAVLLSAITLALSISCADLNPLEIEDVSNSLSIDWIFVEGGTFEMGNTSASDGSNEKPVHAVTLSDFYISKYEITNSQYAKFLHLYGCDTIKKEPYKGEKLIYNHKWGLIKTDSGWAPVTGYENHPVLNVPWCGALEFAKYFGWNITTEAQWEYAARGGKRSQNYIYSGGNNIDEVAWCSVEYEDAPGVHSHPVGGKRPNELGIYDMTGNAWEWCYDWYGLYNGDPITNPTGPLTGSNHIYRGGGWLSTPVNSRNTARQGGGIDYHGFTHNGFRCVKTK